MTNKKQDKEVHKSSRHFDALLCFARSNLQTPDEVFDMIQERMRMAIGTALKELSEYNLMYNLAQYEAWFKAQSTNESPTIDDLKSWHCGEVLFKTKFFDANIHFLNGGSIADVMGVPSISQIDRLNISQVVADGKDSKIDPVAAFVVLAALNRIDEIVDERKAMLEDVPNWVTQFIG